MKNTLTKIQNFGVQSIIKHENKQCLFLNMKNKIKAFFKNIDNENKINFEFYKEYSLDDEILNYHAFGNYVLLIGKSNKKLVLFNQYGDKIKEL